MKNRVWRTCADGMVLASLQEVRNTVRRLGVFFFFSALVAHSAAADPIGTQWSQPGGPGAPVFITYSYSNLLDGALLLASPMELRSATEEALALWASYAPLNFIEVPDAGPIVSDVPYSALGTPEIRIGHHVTPDLAHAYFPGDTGLAGDVHIATGIPWSVGQGHWNFLEAITHELGHSLGLAHELDEPAIMNPSYPFHRFSGLGTSFLFPSDIRALQSIYGAGTGSVQPIDLTPEPTTYLLVASGFFLVSITRHRRRTRAML